MGQTQSKQKIEPRHTYLNVATLYYSNSHRSPYEFFSQKGFAASHRINKIFLEILVEELPDFVSEKEYQKVSGVEKDLQDRYTPLYVRECGINPHMFLMNKQEFMEKWEKKLKDCSEKKFDRQKAQKLQIFDWCVFKALLVSIYGRDSIKGIENADFNLSADKYLNWQNERFDQSYLNQQERVKLMIESLKTHDIDIMFLVEVSQEAMAYIEKSVSKYRIIQANGKSRSIILIKKSRFPSYNSVSLNHNYTLYQRLLNKFTQTATNTLEKQSSSHRQQLLFNHFKGNSDILSEAEKGLIRDKVHQVIKSFNINGSTLIQVVQNLILVCPQLSSKKQSQNAGLVNKPHPSRSKKREEVGHDKENSDGLNKKNSGVLQLVKAALQADAKVQSVKKNNKSQVTALLKVLVELKKLLPTHHIIVGGLLNGEVTSADLQRVYNEQEVGAGDKDSIDNLFKLKGKRSHWLNIAPDASRSITTTKMRTLMQPQRNKVCILNKEVKDYLMTDLRLDAHVMTIRGDRISNNEASWENAITKRLSSRPSAVQLNGNISKINPDAPLEAKDLADFFQDLGEMNIEGDYDFHLLPDSRHPFSSYMVLGKVYLPVEKVAQTADFLYGKTLVANCNGQLDIVQEGKPCGDQESYEPQATAPLALNQIPL